MGQRHGRAVLLLDAFVLVAFGLSVPTEAPDNAQNYLTASVEARSTTYCAAAAIKEVAGYFGTTNSTTPKKSEESFPHPWNFLDEFFLLEYLGCVLPLS